MNEFRSDLSDTTMAALFGEHCLRLYTTYKGTITKTALGAALKPQ